MPVIEVSHWSIDYLQWATVFNWPIAGMHPPAILIYYFYLTKINLFTSANYIFISISYPNQVYDKQRKNISQWWFAYLICHTLIYFFPRVVFSSVLRVVTKKKFLLLTMVATFVNISLTSQFWKNVISFNSLVNALIAP